MTRRHVLLAFGTRPEAIKLAPVIQELQSDRAQFETIVLVTAQHRGMLDQVLGLFDIKPHVDLDVMKPNQSLPDLTSRVMDRLSRVIRLRRPDVVVVQGDTTSAMVSALAAFYERIPVAHVEAGLRTADKYAPFPEEMNRRLITSLADLHFAPTGWARDNLLREGVPRRSIRVTGNTVIDALKTILKSGRPWRIPALQKIEPGHRLILVTAHRRENFGTGLERICQALATIVRRNRYIDMVYPVHLNPNVCKPIRSLLGKSERIHLIEPLEYLPFCHLMKQSYLILTDSGGIQEEAPALCKPVLVLREKTERPEAIAAGTARLVGTDVDRIVTETERLLHSPVAYRQMARAANPFGDGLASKRIAAALKKIPQRTTGR